MTEAKHTPGPWTAKMQFGNWFVRQDPADWNGMGYQFICGLPAKRKGTHYGDMFAANARLISAAPDMLAALQEAERFLDYFANGRTSFFGDGTPRTAHAQVVAAIAKALSADGAARHAPAPDDASGLNPKETAP